MASLPVTPKRVAERKKNILHGWDVTKEAEEEGWLAGWWVGWGCWVPRRLGGYQEGYGTGEKAGYQKGYGKGAEAGYQKGYQKGY